MKNYKWAIDLVARQLTDYLKSQRDAPRFLAMLTTSDDEQECFVVVADVYDNKPIELVVTHHCNQPNDTGLDHRRSTLTYVGHQIPDMSSPKELFKAMYPLSDVVFAFAMQSNVQKDERKD